MTKQERDELIEPIQAQIDKLEDEKDAIQAIFVRDNSPHKPGEVIEYAKGRRGRVVSVKEAWGGRFEAVVIRVRKDGTDGEKHRVYCWDFEAAKKV